MAETQEVRDKVVLVGLSSPVLKKEENADEDTMEARWRRCSSTARTPAPPW